MRTWLFPWNCQLWCATAMCFVYSYLHLISLETEEEGFQLMSETFFDTFHYTIITDKNLLNHCHKKLQYLGECFTLLRKSLHCKFFECWFFILIKWYEFNFSIRKLMNYLKCVIMCWKCQINMRLLKSVFFFSVFMSKHYLGREGGELFTELHCYMYLTLYKVA